MGVWVAKGGGGRLTNKVTQIKRTTKVNEQPLECPYAVPSIIFTVRLYTMPASVASVSFSFAPCVSLCGHLSPSPADGVSHLKGTDYNHLRKVEMSWCSNLSPSLIAAICCSSSLEELVVTSPGVSVLSVCLTTPCIQTAFYCN